MKKLIAVFSVLLLSVVSVFSGEWRSLIGVSNINSVNTCSSDGRIYTATDGGIEIFFGNGSLWLVHNTAATDIPSNNVKKVVAWNKQILASGPDWLARFSPISGEWEVLGKEANDLAVDSSGTFWEASDSGLYYYKPGRTKCDVPLKKILNIAVGDNGAIYGISETGIFRAKIGEDYQLWNLHMGQDMLGKANNIAICGDTVVAPAEKGFYLKIGESDWKTVEWPMIGIGFYTNYKLPVPVSFFQGEIVFGAGSEFFLYNGSRFFNPIPGGAISGVSLINCLAHDDKKLYVGTNNKMLVYDGDNLVKMATVNVSYPHDNNITHINRDNSGRILAGGYFGGYRYDNNSQSPMLNSSEMNVSGPVLASFVDNKKAEWIWKNTQLTRNGKTVNLPVSITGLNYPFWLLQGPGSSASDLWLLTSDPVHRLQVYAGEGTWGNQLNTPEELAKEEILSALSNGKKLWIGTDSAVYSYDFTGNWMRYERGYSRKRFVIGAEETVYVFDYDNLNNCYRLWDLENRTGTKSFPQGIEVNSVYKEDSTFWVATNSGAYYLNLKEDERIGSFWQDVPLRIETGFGHTLADDYVNTIYVDSATNAVWFGTKGGLTVWHRPQATPIKPALKPATKSMQQGNLFDSKVIDLRGRRVNSKNNRLALGINLIQLPNGKMVKNLNLNRLTH